MRHKNYRLQLFSASPGLWGVGRAGAPNVTGLQFWRAKWLVYCPRVFELDREPHSPSYIQSMVGTRFSRHHQLICASRAQYSAQQACAVHHCWVTTGFFHPLLVSYWTKRNQTFQGTLCSPHTIQGSKTLQKSLVGFLVPKLSPLANVMILWTYAIKKERSSNPLLHFQLNCPQETAHWKAAVAGTHCISCQGHLDSKLQGRCQNTWCFTVREKKNKLNPPSTFSSLI